MARSGSWIKNAFFKPDSQGERRTQEKRHRKDGIDHRGSIAESLQQIEETQRSKYDGPLWAINKKPQDNYDVPQGTYVGQQHSYDGPLQPIGKKSRSDRGEPFQAIDERPLEYNGRMSRGLSPYDEAIETPKQQAGIDQGRQGYNRSTSEPLVRNPSPNDEVQGEIKPDHATEENLELQTSVQGEEGNSRILSPHSSHISSRSRITNSDVKIGNRSTIGWEGEGLERLRQYLHALMREHPDIQLQSDITRPISLGQIEMALGSLIGAYFSLSSDRSDLEKRLDRQTEDHASLHSRNEVLVQAIQEASDNALKAENEYLAQVQNMKGKMHSGFESQKRDFNTKIQDLHAREKVLLNNHMALRKNLEDDLDHLKGNHSRELNRLREEHQEQVQADEVAASRLLLTTKQGLEKQILQLQDLHKSSIRNYDNELQQSKEQHKNDVLELSALLETQIHQEQDAHDSTSRNYESKLHQNKEQHRKELLEHSARSDTQILQLNDKHVSQLQETKEKYQKELSELSAVLEAERTDHEAEISELKTMHKTKQLSQTRSLQQTVEVLKEALVRRDNFKAMSDHELAQRFQDISSEVDSLARLRWEKILESSWPVPGRWFEKSENQRQAKQYFIQNAIWVILYTRIFCTPFRVFGNEGTRLEQDWAQNYGADPTFIGGSCPRPSKESEEWRYISMKDYVEAIIQTQTDSQSIKSGYESTLKDSSNEICHEIECIAVISGGVRQRVCELVRMAAEFWLEVGQLRCRIFLSMSESGEMPKLSRVASLSPNSCINLVVQPELRRIGNRQGDRLENEEMIFGCEGKFTIFRGD